MTLCKATDYQVTHLRGIRSSPALALFICGLRLYLVCYQGLDWSPDQSYLSGIGDQHYTDGFPQIHLVG